MRFTVVILSALLCFTARAQTAVSEKDSDEAIMAAAEKLVNEGKPLKTEDVKGESEGESDSTTAPAATAAASETAIAAPASTADATKATPVIDESKKESEIPIFTKSDKVAKSESSLVWRLVASMALIAVIGGAMVLAGRRWGNKKNKGGEKVRIEILHQYNLGPRKSLALVRVAGEALLIGCTDHSINMLKTVTLIDDELEGILGNDFNGFLEDDFKIEDMRTALAPRT